LKYGVKPMLKTVKRVFKWLGVHGMEVMLGLTTGILLNMALV